jgi:hypothetical protein
MRTFLQGKEYFPEVKVNSLAVIAVLAILSS